MLRSGYKVLSPPSARFNVEGNTNFWKAIWCLEVPPKVINLLWRGCRELLSTRKALWNRRVLSHAMVFVQLVQVRRRVCFKPWLPARQGVGHGSMKGWPPYLMAMTLSLNGGESYASDGQMRE